MATTTKYKPYPKMKPAGVDWIGKIPDEWDAKRVRYVLNSVGGNGFPEELQGRLEGDYPFYKVSDINGEKIFLEKSNNYVDRADVLENNWKVVPKGSIVTAKIGAALSLNHRKITTKDSLIDNNMLGLSLKSEKFDSNYVYYLFKVIDMDWFVNPGAVPSVNIGQFIDTFLPFPQKEEQKTIVVFLDRETVKIDNVVAKKQKLIELLKEKRQALITHAVTKGLDPKAKMKPSCIDWLGSIPEKWGVKRLNYLAKNVVDKATDTDENKFIIALENIESWTGRLLLPENQKVPEGDLKRFSAGDVLFGKLRPYLAKATLTNQRGLCVGEALVFRANEFLINKFLLYRILATDFIRYVDGSTQGAKMPRAEWEFIKTLEVAYPSRNEQQKIIDYVDSETGKIDEIIKKVATQIEKLQEYRQALISNAVTGKIKV